MSIYIRYYFVLIASLFWRGSTIYAQELVKTIATSEGRFISTDELGNVYWVGEENALVKYSPDGDSLTSYRSIINGDLKMVDVTNPLKMLLYYPNFGKLVVLDRLLTVVQEIDLRKMNIYNAPAAGLSVDGRIWVYDAMTAQLKKIDEQFNITTTSNDLRQETHTVPKPTALLERNNRVYLSDTKNGIFVLDRFGAYLNTLEIKNVKKIQAFGNQLIYRVGHELISYNIKTLQASKIELPSADDFVEARIERNRLYYLFKNRLEIYSIPNEE
jgi:hypothetical protein